MSLMPFALAAATTLSELHVSHTSECREKMTALTKVREASGASVHGSLAVLPELIVDPVGTCDVVESPA